MKGIENERSEVFILKMGNMKFKMLAFSVYLLLMIWTKPFSNK